MLKIAELQALIEWLMKITLLHSSSKNVHIVFENMNLLIILDKDFVANYIVHAVHYL